MCVITAGAIAEYRTVSGWWPAPSTTAADTLPPHRCASTPSAHGGSVPARRASPTTTTGFFIASLTMSSFDRVPIGPAPTGPAENKNALDTVR